MEKIGKESHLEEKRDERREKEKKGERERERRWSYRSLKVGPERFGEGKEKTKEMM